MLHSSPCVYMSFHCHHMITQAWTKCSRRSPWVTKIAHFSANQSGAISSKNGDFVSSKGAMSSPRQSYNKEQQRGCNKHPFTF